MSDASNQQTAQAFQAGVNVLLARLDAVPEDAEDWGTIAQQAESIARLARKAQRNCAKGKTA